MHTAARNGSTPLGFPARGEGNKKWGYTNNNRYHMLDDIPFTSSVQFDMEIWHPFRKHMNYAAATFSTQGLGPRTTSNRTSRRFGTT